MGARNFEVYNLTSVLLLMRFPSFPNLVRTLYTLSNATARLQSPLRGNTYISPFSRTAVLRSMPSLPFLSSFFGTSAPASETMSYSDGRSNDEWRAVLNKEQFRVLREKGTEAPFTGEYGQHLWHGADRDSVFELWRPFGTRFQGRGLSDADGREALCEQYQFEVP